MTYEHLSVMCLLDQTGACFTKLSADGWEFLDSHVVPYEQRANNVVVTARQPAVIVPHLFSVWRREKVEANEPSPADTELGRQAFGENGE